MCDTDILQDLGEDEIRVTGGGLYSPMMRKHLREDTVEKKMKEDSFEVTNKQADPDYETIHFNRGRGSQRRAEDKIESASVLDFSSKKRELVLGIDRKPELRPLSAFKQSPIDKHEDPQKQDTFSLEIDANEESETISDVDDHHHQDMDEVPTPEHVTESETSTLSENPFLKQQSNNFKFNKSRSSPRTTKAEFHSPPKQFVKRNLVDNGNLKKNLTAALIRQFNHGKSQENSPPEISTSVKTSTKQLINKESI